jgi:hypothetical protein
LYTGFPIWSVDAIEGNGVRTVLIEDVSGFARDMQAHHSI